MILSTREILMVPLMVTSHAKFSAELLLTYRNSGNVLSFQPFAGLVHPFS